MNILERRPDSSTSSGRYCHLATGQPIRIDTDGCAWEQWEHGTEDYPFARHPLGFPVFLTPDAIQAADEYREMDPYSLEANLGGAFHQRRIRCTLDLIHRAAETLGRLERICDLGCGLGHITHAISEKMPDAEISAFDASVTAIVHATKRFPEIEFAVADAYAPPFAGGYFDVVVANNIWEHVPDPLRMLGAIRHITAPDGFLIISTPSRYRLENLTRILRGRQVRFMSAQHVTEYSVGQVIEQLDARGYDLVERMAPPIDPGSARARLAQKVVSRMLRWMGSHHSLESTVFYLAGKRVDCHAENASIP